MRKEWGLANCKKHGALVNLKYNCELISVDSVNVDASALNLHSSGVQQWQLLDAFSHSQVTC